MWNGKLKAVTFSFDDGTTQDVQLIKLLDKYGMKATFNLNSSFFGIKERLTRNGKDIPFEKVNPFDVKSIYANHEVAVHTLTHADLVIADEDTIFWQVEKDRQVLSELVGYQVVGMAYPNGGINNDDRVASVIKRRTGVKYSRTITSTYNFDLQTNLYRFNPTIHWGDELVYGIIDKFVALKTDKPQLLYIWGHSFEIDSGTANLVKFEQALKKLSMQSDIFFGTNKEVLL